MAYGMYADSGPSFGKILYQLSLVGVPVRVVEQVVLQGSLADATLYYHDEPFAKVVWHDELNGRKDVPVFKFLGHGMELFTRAQKFYHDCISSYSGAAVNESND